MAFYVLFNFVAGCWLLLRSIRNGKKPKTLSARLWLLFLPIYGYGNNEYAWIEPWEKEEDPGKAYFVWSRMVSLNVVFIILCLCHGLYLNNQYGADVALGNMGVDTLKMAKNDKEVSDLLHTWMLWRYLFFMPVVFVGIPLMATRICRLSQK